LKKSLLPHKGESIRCEFLPCLPNKRNRAHRPPNGGSVGGGGSGCGGGVGGGGDDGGGGQAVPYLHSPPKIMQEHANAEQ
jgi:hypothetical protein